VFRTRQGTKRTHHPALTMGELKTLSENTSLASAISNATQYNQPSNKGGNDHENRHLVTTLVQLDHNRAVILLVPLPDRWNSTSHLRTRRPDPNCRG
jgi:hypothetical protein